MCGIFAYVGNRKNAAGIVQGGLQRLSYRGYDSWGIVVLDDHKLVIKKSTGRVPEKLVHLPQSNIGLGHTRWATHGGVTTRNAHPHVASDDLFALVHNGIFENYLDYKSALAGNYTFHSETDTEVLVRLIESERQSASDLMAATCSAFAKVSGRNTIAIIGDSGELIAARNGSPLVIGRNTATGEFFLSSDILSFASLVDQVCVIDNGQIIRYQNGELTSYRLGRTGESTLHWVPNTVEQGLIEKEGYSHFMLKEIFEQPRVIKQMGTRASQELMTVAAAVQSAPHVYTIGSGTTGIAAAQIAYYLRTIAKVSAVSLVGAEAQSYLPLFTRGDLLIAPSQSGETADVLEIVELAKQKGVLVASCVNMQGSMLTKLSDYPAMVQAGPEICVCSTKVFTAHLAWGYLLAKAVVGQLADGVKNIHRLSTSLGELLKSQTFHTSLKQLARDLCKKEHIFLLAKGQNLQIAAEGMVKIIEQSYIHAHAIPAGDLKHYAITLMEKSVLVLALLSHDEVAADVESAIHEVEARGATVTIINSLVPDLGEVSAIANIVPLQLLAYYLGLALGRDIDKPRNIAKSVTVK